VYISTMFVFCRDIIKLSPCTQIGGCLTLNIERVSLLGNFVTLFDASLVVPATKI